MLGRMFNEVVGGSDEEELDDSRRTVLRKAAAGGVALGMLPAATGSAAGQEIDIDEDEVPEGTDCEHMRTTCPDEDDLTVDYEEEEENDTIVVDDDINDPDCEHMRTTCPDEEDLTVEQQPMVRAPREPVCNGGPPIGACAGVECCSGDCDCHECVPVPRRPPACRGGRLRDLACGPAGVLGSRCECVCA